jgi:hypothetical protein
MHAGFGRLDRIELIVNWTSGTGEIVNLINFNIERKGHIVTHYLKVVMGEEVRNVAPSSGKEVIHTKHFVALRKQLLTKKRTDEARSTGN